MELEFHKSTISCLKQTVRETGNQEFTQEIRLTEAMPDIGTVLGCWGQVLVRGKEWKSNTVSASGGIMVWVLYAPEEEGTPVSTECWIPFSLKWNFPDTDREGRFRLYCTIRSADARSISARKLLVRVNLSTFAEAWVPYDAVTYVPENLPEDLQLLRKAETV